MGFFDKLKNGLNKTKTSFDEKMNDIFSNFRKVDENLLEELEEALIMSDVGANTSATIINNLRERVKKENIKDEQGVREALRKEIQEIFDATDNTLKLETKPAVILVVGVNSDASVKRLKGPERPIISEEERMELLADLQCVSYVVKFSEDTPYELIKKLQPDIITKGGDYKPEDVVGKDIVEARGGRVIICKLVEGKSTTNIITKIKNSK